MRIALCQLNPVVGDVPGNLALVRRALEQVRLPAPELAVFPELVLTGYPPLDLLERSWFIDRAEHGRLELQELSRDYPDTGIIFGTVVRTGRTSGKGLHNAAILVQNGAELLCQPKTLLPTYDVFDESRYFDPADVVKTVRFKNEVLGVTVCEDAWTGCAGHNPIPSAESGLCPKPDVYNRDPVAELARAGATLLVNVSASPFAEGKDFVRYGFLAGHCRRHRLPLAFVNQVGGNDELVFDGGSMVLDSSGRPTSILESFGEETRIADTGAQGAGEFRALGRIESVHRALVLGLSDYCRKCGFRQAVIGLSGGIDSAVACCLAVAALGRDNVLGVTMPSEYSSRGSVEDSKLLAANLGIELRVIPIGNTYHSYLATLAAVGETDQGPLRCTNTATPAAGGPSVTEENLQARVRGNILMALSNKLGHLVITTGNKSELAVGYCTLYGDMSGGLAILADVPKTMVYELARYINRERELVPQATLAKPPSAELRPNQTDQDSLPPYDVLDPILEHYVEDGWSEEQIVKAGFDPVTLGRVCGMVRRNEYKRAQAAPGIKVSSKAFGIGRRMPIAARY